MLAATPAQAYHRQRQDELERLIDQQRSKVERSKKQERSLLHQLDESDKRRELLEVQLRAARQDLASAEAELKRLDVRLRRLDDQVAQKTSELETMLGNLYEHETTLRERVAYFYINAPNQLAASVGAADATEVGDAYTFAKSVFESDQRLIQEIESSKDALSARRAQLQGVQAEVAEMHAQQARETERLANAAAAVRRASEAVEAEIQTKNQLLGKVRDQRAEYQRILKSYERENARIAAFLRGSGSSGGSGAVRGQGGYLVWPVSGSITSPYGWRTHPIYKSRSFHTGIDIGASMGTPTDAARSGRVIQTGYMGAYGLAVIIDHGGGIATLYAHLSAISVSSGQSVSTGDVIGRVGSTGYSTGPHLHFEVRVNGSHTNPMQWL